MTSWLRLATEALPDPGTEGSWARRFAEGVANLGTLGDASVGALSGEGPWLKQLWEALSPRPTYGGANWFQRLSGGGGANRYLQVTSVSGLNRNAAAVFCVCAPTDSLNTREYFTAKNAGGSAILKISTGDTAGLFGFNSNTNQTALHPRAMPSVVGLASSSGNTRVYVRGTSSSFATAVTTGVADGVFQIGRDTNSFLGDYWALIAYTTFKDQTTSNAIVASLETAFNIPTSFTGKLVFTGNSIMEGYKADNCQNTPREMTRLGLIPAGYEIYNMAISGWTVTNENASQKAANLVGPGDILLTGIGSNSISGVAGSSATLYSGTYTTLMNAYKARGATICAMTILPRSIFASGQTNIEWADFNTRVRGNAVGIDKIIDIQAEPTMGPIAAQSDLALYIDGIHPSVHGHTLLAEYIGARLFV